MIELKRALSAWGSADFRKVLKAEIEQLPSDTLPLQEGMSHSSYVSEEPFKVMIIDIRDDTDIIYAKVGIFYSGIIAGCSCADDPTPIDSQPEYCLVCLNIDKQTAWTGVSLLPD
ncbi:MAG: hypothetical protein KZQ80_17675 [Candidatus Thiodiazotropha sp. (ex Monitilora ramsayi)]|nr:hypothetical protein [Candidatus Thiodiazotropha sp. (ex Monitilora ramsayi)]